MKRMTKKLGAIVLAMAMCLSLCCTALVSAAEGDYTITISNTTQGYTYAAYKIFDATVSEDGNVAYYITTDNPWFEIITEDYEADVTTGVYETECFVLTPTYTDGQYSVTVKDKVQDADIIAYFNSQITMTGPDENGQYTLSAPEGVNAAATENGNGGSLILDVSDSQYGGAGYYFVTSTLGATVTITTTDPQASVIDKNTPPGNVNKVVYNGLLGDENTDSEDGTLHGDTEAIGDDVEFKVTADVPLYAPGDTVEPEGYLITDYEFDDEMSSGLEIRGLTQYTGTGTAKTDGSETEYWTETVNGETHYYASDALIDKWVTLTQGSTTNGLTEVAYNVKLELIDATTDEDGNIQFDGFILTYDTLDFAYDDDGNRIGVWKDASHTEYLNLDDYETAAELVAASGSKYPVNATITIDYYAHVTEDAEYDNTNEIDMIWHMTPFNGPTPLKPEYGDDDKDKDDVYVLELDILKIDGLDGTALEGAQFQLTGKNLNQVVTSTDYHYSSLADYAAYESAKNEGTELWFKLTDGNYTNVDPYDIYVVNPNDPELQNYVWNTYADDPTTYPDAEGYYFVAYTRTVTHSGGLESASETTVTGWTDEDGKLTFSGLTIGDWTLTEITAPDGYNLLPGDLTFTISVSWQTAADGSIVPVFSIDETGTNNGYSYSNGVVSITVENNAGTELPGTGGIGTTIFYIIGGVLVVGAVVVLVTRRRMTRES